MNLITLNRSNKNCFPPVTSDTFHPLNYRRRVTGQWLTGRPLSRCILKYLFYPYPGRAEIPSQTLFTTIKPAYPYHHLQVRLAKCHRVRQMLHGECEVFFACGHPYGNYRIIERDVTHAAGLFWDTSPQVPIQVKRWRKQTPPPAWISGQSVSQSGHSFFDENTQSTGEILKIIFYHKIIFS